MSSPVARRKIGSRACDACKVRKVRCSEAPPCTRCASIGIECTFNKRQATRGPRSLRAKTLAEIRAFQEAQDQRQAASGAPSEGGSQMSDENDPARRGSASSSDATPPDRGTPVSSLIVRLCLYNQRLFPVWPILIVEDVIGSLLRHPADNETYALANAVCAAIIAQLKLPFAGRTDDNDPATAVSMAAECLRAKISLRSGDDGPDMNLNMLRISFFQHIYHENMSPGGSKSLLFLREAITIAQIMGLHRKSTYLPLPAEEQQMRRRVIWLLFVTERGVAMLHQLPTVLTWQNSFPGLDGPGEQDEAQILPAFKKLVDLFWTLDQGGTFDLIHADDSSNMQRSSRLDSLQHRLQNMSEDDGGAHHEVQKVDIVVTKSWMQTVLWRARASAFPRTARNHGQAALLLQPYRIVHDFLSHISHYSKTALEAHGPTIELKIFEIASALTDALATNLALLRTSAGLGARPVDMLIQLQRLLASSRGGNKALLTLLCARIARVEGGGSSKLSAGPPHLPFEGEGQENEGDGAYQRERRARERVSHPVYPDTMRLDYIQQQPTWQESRSVSQSISVDSEGNLGIMPTPLAHESWDGWTVDLPGMCQLP